MKPINKITPVLFLLLIVLFMMLWHSSSGKNRLVLHEKTAIGIFEYILRNELKL